MKVLLIGHSALCTAQKVRPLRPDAAHASRAVTCAGGTAANIAATLALLGDEPVLHTPTAPGSGGAFIRDDLRELGVEVHDTWPRLDETPTITVTVDERGHAAVASEMPSGLYWDDTASDRAARLVTTAAPDVVVLDPHVPSVAVPVAAYAAGAGIPVITMVDALRNRTDEILRHTDLVIATMYAGAEGDADAHLDQLIGAGAVSGVVVHGPEAIYRAQGTQDRVTIPPALRVCDPSFASHVFAGSLIHSGLGATVLDAGETGEALERALLRAQASTFHLGLREWAEHRVSAPLVGPSPRPLLRVV